MVITIEVPDDTVATLIAQARAQGRAASDLAAEAVVDRFGTDTEQEFPLDTELIENIRRGIEDMNAGRTISLKQSRAQIEVLLAARSRKEAA